MPISARRPEDAAARDRINALNGLEQTCYSTRNNLDQNDGDLKSKLTPEESEALDAAVKKALAWLEEHGALMESVRTGTQVSGWTGPPAPEPAVPPARVSL